MGDIDNIILEHLRVLRGDVSALKDGQRELRAEVGSIRGYLAAMHSDIANSGSRTDSLEVRIERIEQRLGLRDN